MNAQPTMSAQDACDTLRWIERARGHIAELERDPRQVEYMEIAAEIRRGVQASERSLALWHGARDRTGPLPTHLPIRRTLYCRRSNAHLSTARQGVRRWTR
jgi:hypothetical protein